MTDTMNTPTVHDLTAQLTRERARAVALVRKLENIGVKPSKRLTAAREAQAAHSKLLAEKRRDAATVEHEITEAAATANGDALTDSSPSYLLRREDSGLRATVCIQTDDMEKLQALAESRGVDLAFRSE